MAAPDFDAVAGGIVANLQVAVSDLRRVFDHEPSATVALGNLPYATVYLDPITRPGVNEPSGEIGPRYYTTAEWIVRVYDRLRDGEDHQRRYRLLAAGLLDAWDQYRLLNAPPGNVPLVNDSAITRIEPLVDQDRKHPVFWANATVQTFSIA